MKLLKYPLMAILAVAAPIAIVSVGIVVVVVYIADQGWVFKDE
ncbi:hypothetical protein [Adhaeribacter aquaticus]|nr:hypothetical protein [Adhaeribacter aquaticus]